MFLMCINLYLHPHIHVCVYLYIYIYFHMSCRQRLPRFSHWRAAALARDIFWVAVAATQSGHLLEALRLLGA